MGYSDLGRELAGYFGRGLEKGIGEEQGIQSAMRSFGRLKPMREAQREEEFQYETRRGKAKGEMEAEFKRQAQEEEDTAAREAYGDLWGQLFPPTVTPGAGPAREPTSVSEQLREPGPLVTRAKPPRGARGGQLEKAMTIQAGLVKGAQKRGGVGKPTHVEMLVAYTNPDDPLYEKAKNYFEGTGEEVAHPEFGPMRERPGYVAQQRMISGQRARGPLDVRPDYPLEPTPAIAADVREADVLLKQLDEVEKGFEANKHLVGGIAAGAGRARRGLRQTFGEGPLGFIPGVTSPLSPEEQGWLAKADQFRGGQILEFFGKVVPKGETELATRTIPDINEMQPSQFKAAIRATRERIRMYRSQLGQQLRDPRGGIGQPPRPPSGTNPDIGRRF